MSASWLYIIELIVLMIAIMIIYSYAKGLFLEKLKANKWSKWISGVISLLFFLLNNYIGLNFGVPSIQYNIGMAFTIFSLLVTFDLFGWTKSKKRSIQKKDDIVIKPKAKPNRAKHKDNL